jgi:hypothetical protein
MQKIVLLITILVSFLGCESTKNTRTEDIQVDNNIREDIERTVYQFYDHCSKSEWNFAGALMHPDALEQFKAMIVDLDTEGELTTAIGIASEEELNNIDPIVFFARFLSLLATVPQYAMLLSQIDIEVMGSLYNEDGETGYVVYKASIYTADIHFEKLYVVALRQHEGSWLLLLKGALENLAPTM